MSESKWPARMVFWSLLAGFAGFMSQWRDVGMDYRRAGVVAIAAAVVALVVVAVLRRVWRRR